MTETQKKSAWITTHWIVFSGTPATEDFHIHGCGNSERAAWHDAAANGMPPGAKVGQVRVRV